MTIHIRQATPQDWQIYKKIRLETLKEEPQAFSSKYEHALNYSDNTWKKLLEENDSVFLLVLDEDKAIGIGRVTFDDPEEPDHVAIIGGVYINWRYRGQKIGKKLLVSLIDSAKKRQDIKTVRLHVRESQSIAMNLYLSLGFKQQNSTRGELTMDFEVINLPN